MLIALILSPITIFAQSDTTYWNKGGRVSVNANLTSLQNWSAGGVDSYAGGAFANYFFDYKKGKAVWTNTFDIGFGFIKENGADARKADDRIIFTSQYGRKMGSSGKWFYDAMVDFRTQFAEGFENPEDSLYISRFMAPGYLLVSIGIDYKPKDYFNISFGPLSGKTTFVLDQRLADSGAFGVEEADVDANGTIIPDTGKMVRYEFGATIKATFNKEIFTNTTFASNLLLFTNYMKNPGKVDVNWENTLSLKVNDFLAASIFLQTIYDYDIKFYEMDANGDPIEGTEEDRWQFKSVVGVGLSYKFGGTRGKK